MDVTQENLVVTILEHSSTVTSLSSEELASVDIETIWQDYFQNTEKSQREA